MVVEVSFCTATFYISLPSSRGLIEIPIYTSIWASCGHSSWTHIFKWFIMARGVNLDMKSDVKDYDGIRLYVQTIDPF